MSADESPSTDVLAERLRLFMEFQEERDRKRDQSDRDREAKQEERWKGLREAVKLGNADKVTREEFAYQLNGHEVRITELKEHSNATLNHSDRIAALEKRAAVEDEQVRDESMTRRSALVYALRVGVIIAVLTVLLTSIVQHLWS